MRHLVSSVTIWSFLLVVAVGPSEATVAPKCAADDSARVRSGFRIVAWQFVDSSPQGWSITVQDRKVRVTATDGDQTFRLSERDARDLRLFIRSQKVWSLSSEYGAPSSRDSFRVLDVCDGERVHRITVHADLNAEGREDDVRRFLRVWARLRRLFVSKSAADFEEADIDLLLRKQKP